MIESYIKYFFMLVCAFYCQTKILNKKITKLNIFKNVLAFTLSTLLIYIARMYAPHITILTLVIFCFVHSSLTYDTPFKLNIMGSLLSVTLCHFLFFISSVCITAITVIAIKNVDTLGNIYLITLPIIGVVQLFLARILFKLRPLKYGMPFLLQEIPNTIGIIICIFVVGLISLFTILDTNENFYGLIIIGSTILSFLLFIWWKAQMTLSYANKAANLEITRLDTTVKKLENDIEILSTLVHKDNKLIPAMEMAVCDLLNNLYINSNDDLHKHASTLLADIKKLSIERNGILEHTSEHRHSLPNLGLVRLDAALRYMYEKSFSNNLSLDISTLFKPEELIGKYISEDELVTLVCDLLENSFISTDNCKIRKILLEFSIYTNNDNKNIYCINFYDTGIPFTPFTIINAGKKRASTHLDKGGSGIGLMTTFSLLNKYCASFVIDEHPQNAEYTKKVSIVFDFLNQFRVYTSRKEILDITEQTSDVIIERVSEI